MAARLGDRARPDPIELEAEDEGRAAALFLALGTQWKWTGMGVRVGLDYGAIEPAARLLGIAFDRSVMLDLQAMEAEALATFGEAAAR